MVAWARLCRSLVGGVLHEKHAASNATARLSQSCILRRVNPATPNQPYTDDERHEALWQTWQ